MQKRHQAILLIILSFLFVQKHTAAQELTIYTIPPPRAINWHSPRDLVFSYLKNSLTSSPYKKQRHSIGHVLVELRDSSRYALVGTVAASKKSMTRMVVKKGFGLGIFLDTIPGKMQETAENLSCLTKRCGTGDISFVRYEISSAVFERLWQYLQEYKQRGYDKLYNGSNKPLEGGGAGCSAFGVSFLEVGGLKELFPVNDWIIHVHAPLRLIGGPANPGHYVNPLRLFFRAHWANEANEPFRDITYYDPTVMYNQIRLKYDGGFSDTHTSKLMIGQACGFLIHCRERMAPEMPIWPSYPK